MTQVSYHFHPDKMWGEVTVVGEVSNHEALDIYDRFIADTRFKKGMHLLCDLRQAELKTKLELVQELIDHVAASRVQRGEDYRVAILVSYAFQESMSRLYAAQARAQPFECLVFKSRATALQWLLGKPSALSR